MAGIIKLTTRRIPQNVLRLGIRTLDDIEVCKIILKNHKI